MSSATLAVQDAYPLTPTQKGMLFHRLLDEHSGIDVQQLVLEDPVHTERDTWRQLMARHPVLRTSFRWEGRDEPAQEVWADVDLPWSESQQDLESFLRDDRARGFALDAPPLMRLTWLASERKLVWTFHHALLDSTSVSLLLEGAADARRFGEFVGWVEQRESSEAFWREVMRGFTAPTPLPFSRPTGSGFAEIEIDRSASEAEVLAAWTELLSRHSGESDVVFGVAKSRRPPGFERAVGMFVNTVPYRPRTMSLDALREHEHTPLVDIQRWSEVHGSLFDTLVVLDDSDVRLLERTSYPLALTVYRDSMKLSYDRARIDDAAAQRVANQLVQLLTAGELADEIPAEWNDTARDFDLSGSVHALFEAQVAKTPDRVAINGLTYRELDERANAIAARLQELGAGADTLVGILMERSTDMVAALLGILKAGGAYVPLDPTYPVERLAYMLEDSAAPVLVTQTSLASLIPTKAAILRVDDVGRASARPSPRPAEGRAEARPTSDSLAYVIYTSGSTGKPKGVQLPHRSVLNFLHTMRERPGLAPDDVLLAVTTLSFDIAGLELWLPLTTGARIELVSREVAADGRRLIDALAQSGATVMQATPATWRMLLEAGWKGDPKLKVLCGGEAMPRDLAERLLPLCGSLWNLYGPTETTIWSTVEHVRDTRDAGASIAIGRPIANTTIHLLDAQLRPVPIGAAGELHIGGAGLARGYLHRPELTGERFITWNGQRLYKTGDAARYLPDGRIEYLNRLDNQVKLRGYRIELGEIEAALRKHPAIDDAVVTAGSALNAYFISGQKPAASELREHLKKTLPEYMVPSFFMQLDAFPLTPNGKVDRRALPLPDRGAREEHELIPPRDELETRLAKLWCEVLGISRVGITDNFFEIGGDSLLALRLFVKIESDFGRRLPLATLIQSSTIQALASTLRQEGFDAPWSPLVTLQASGTKPPFFCVHGVGGNVIGYQPLAKHLGGDQPFHGLQARGLDGQQDPLTRIEEMAALYVDEVRKVQPHGPYHLGGLSFGGVVAFEMAQQLVRAGEEVALVALFDTAPVGGPQRGAKRMRTHLDVLLHGPDRFAYLLKRIRRVWRRVVYRTWQTAFAVFDRFKRPLPRALRDVQQANYLALRLYRPSVYPGRVVFFYAEREPGGFTHEKQHGWSALARDGVKSEQVPGDHLTMLEEPHVQGLAEKLARHIL